MIAGMARVRKIARMKFEGGASNLTQSGGASVSSYTNTTAGGGGYQNVQQLNPQKEQPTIVYVSIGDQPVYAAVQRTNERRNQNGQRSFALEG